MMFRRYVFLRVQLLYCALLPGAQFNIFFGCIHLIKTRPFSFSSYVFVFFWSQALLMKIDAFHYIQLGTVYR